jgi:ABC-type multidrug transport system fused ATPase/permease subunit
MDFIFKFIGNNIAAGIIICLILIIFLFAFVLNFYLKRKYRELLRSIDNKHQQRTAKFHSSLINNILEDYKSAAMGNSSEVNTQAIIEKRFNTQLSSYLVVERFLKGASGLLIILGLLGTFLGLTIAISTLVDTIGGISGEELVDASEGIVDGLIAGVSGMGIAFITSLVAIATAIIMNVINMLFNVESLKETVMVHIEEYLDNTISLVVNKDKDTEFTMMNTILRKTFVEFGDKIEKTMLKTVDSLG